MEVNCKWCARHGNNTHLMKVQLPRGNKVHAVSNNQSARRVVTMCGYELWRMWY